MMRCVHRTQYTKILFRIAWAPLIKDRRFSSTREDTKSEMQMDRARQHHSFQIAAFADQIVDGVSMADSHDVLLDDGAVVQLLRHVVARGSNQLDAPVIRLMIRTRPDKCRQKRVVNIDDPVGIRAANSGPRICIYRASTTRSMRFFSSNANSF